MIIPLLSYLQGICLFGAVLSLLRRLFVALPKKRTLIIFVDFDFQNK